MLENIVSNKDQLSFIAIMAIYAGLLPSVTYLTFLIRTRTKDNLSMIQGLHLEVRRLFRLNAIVVSYFKEKGVEIELSPTSFEFPLLLDDIQKTSFEIADEEAKKQSKDHVKQLKRIMADMKEIADNEGLIGILTGLNIPVILLSIVLIIAGILTGWTAIGALLAVIGVIVLILDLIAKFVQGKISDNNKARLKRLEAEIESKKKNLEEQVKGSQQTM